MSEQPRSILLRELAKGPAYGLELIDRTSLHFGNVYPTLRALEREGVVVSYTVERTGEPGRPRRYYKLTDDGHREAKDAG